MRVPAGTYIARAIPETLVLGSDSQGGPQVAMSLTLQNEGYEGERVGWYGSLVGGAAPISLREMRIAGWNSDSFSDPTGLGTVDVEVRITHETKPDGGTRMRVSIREPGGPIVKMERPMNAGQIRALDAQLKRQIQESRRAKPPTATRPGPPPPTDSEGRANARLRAGTLPVDPFAEAVPYTPARAASAPAQPRRTTWDGTGPDPNDDGRPYPSDDLPF